MDALVGVVNGFNTVLLCLFGVIYAYQVFYALLALVRKPKIPKGEKIHSLAVLVAARNEEKVIPYLLESLEAQDYPKESYRVFVVADNCTDRTAEVARAHGAVVFERTDTERVGKGYAMEYLLSAIDASEEGPFDAYVVFDADNLAEENFLTEINKVYGGGAEIIAAALPCVVTFTKPSFEPRYPTLMRKMAAGRAVIPVLTEAELSSIDLNAAGLKGSPTKVKKTFVPQRKTGGMKIENADAESGALELFAALSAAKII